MHDLGQQAGVRAGSGVQPIGALWQVSHVVLAVAGDYSLATRDSPCAFFRQLFELSLEAACLNA